MLPGNERDDLEHGGKIIMPPSALDQLTRLNIVYPMLFKLTNPATSRTTHCGVLEFIADEGKHFSDFFLIPTYLQFDEIFFSFFRKSVPSLLDDAKPRN